MGWKDKPKAERFGDIGSWSGLVVAVIVGQVFAADAEFWVRVPIYVVCMLLGRVIGKQIGLRQGG